MKRNRFLDNLKSEGKLELVEPSREICESYLEKSDNCVTSARLLSDNSLYENSVTMSYYAMYNSLTALMFRVGIKCENHAGSILLLRLLFDEEGLFKMISDAKSERIDKQYYVSTEEDKLTKDTTKELLIKAEKFVIRIKLIINNMDNKDIEEIRAKFV